MVGPCYYCGKENSSGEHIPPKQMFKGFTFGGFQVPSCNDHNVNKSGTDDAIIKMMIEGLISKKSELHEDIQKAIDYQFEYFEQVKKSVTLVKFSPENTLILPHISGNHNIDEWIKEISAGIIWSIKRCYNEKIKFDNAYVFKANFAYGAVEINNLSNLKKQLETTIDLEMKYESIDWQNGWILRKPGYPEHLFKYFYYLYDYEVQAIIFKYIFYDNYTYYCINEIPNDLYNDFAIEIEKKLGRRL